MFFFDRISSSSQNSRPAATTLNTAAAVIFTGEDVFYPVRVVGFGARVTTATAGAPTTRAQWVLRTLDNDDTTVANKAYLRFPNAGTAIGDIIYSDLELDGLDFNLEPGQRIRVAVETASAMPGGSAAGAAVPLIDYKAVSHNPLASTYSYVTRVAATAAAV